MKDEFEWLEKYFLDLRFNEKHHLGLGDIRITLGQQDEILERLRNDHAAHDAEVAAKALEEVHEELAEYAKVCGSPMFHILRKAAEYRAKATEAGRKE